MSHHIVSECGADLAGRGSMPRVESWRGSDEKQKQLPEGTERATSATLQLLRMREDLRPGPILRDIANLPIRTLQAQKWHACMLTEVARLVPPESGSGLSVVVVLWLPNDALALEAGSLEIPSPISKYTELCVKP